VSIQVALAQINPHVGAIDKNVEMIISYTQRAQSEGADLVIFPELALSGYPPEDLLLRPGFLTQMEEALQYLADNSAKDIKSSSIALIVGHPMLGDDGALYNAASLIRGGEVELSYWKQELPNYGVFDEKRYFSSGDSAELFELKGTKFAITICEDLWHPAVAKQAKNAGAEMIVNLNASPYHLGKRGDREDMVRQRVKGTKLPVFYVNQVGGQDELVFDGGSFVLDSDGCKVLSGEHFKEGIYFCNTNQVKGKRNEVNEELLSLTNYSTEEELYAALVLGVKDYVGKNGFKGVVIGLSGGIDSALTLAIAVDALGSNRVEGVTMPSRYSADMSAEDAESEARRVGILFRSISIEPTFNAFMQSLEGEFSGYGVDVTEENIQARCRGVILMAIANKKRLMVLTTGNKSELAVGYSTLYGDMAGGFAPLKDLSKQMVYRLAEWRNSDALAKGEDLVIPQRVIERPPSAELAPDQQDSDSLPEYEVLDQILELYVEQDSCVTDIVAAGFEQELVERITRMVDRNEHKRRQAPPGVRITPRAFGRDRRYPITSGFQSR